jgi:hypothetical protein
MRILSRTRQSSNTSPPCPDLRRLCRRHRWRCHHDPALDGPSTDPWTAVLEARRGCVFPFGQTVLAVEAYDRLAAYQLIGLLGHHAIHQWGEDVWCFVFTPPWLRQVAKVIRPWSVPRAGRGQRRGADRG